MWNVGPRFFFAHFLYENSLNQSLNFLEISRRPSEILRILRGNSRLNGSEYVV